MDALTAEINAQETNPKRLESNAEKGAGLENMRSDKNRVLRKLYRTKGKARGLHESSSSGSEMELISRAKENMAQTPNRGVVRRAIIIIVRPAEPPGLSRLVRSRVCLLCLFRIEWQLVLRHISDYKLSRYPEN